MRSSVLLLTISLQLLAQQAIACVIHLCLSSLLSFTHYIYSLTKPGLGIFEEILRVGLAILKKVVIL